MTVTVEQLQAYVGTTETGSFIEGCLDSGTLLVTNYIGTKSVPEAIKDECILHVSSELFHRRSAPNGIAQFASMDGTPIRVGRDPMAAVYSLLMPFTGWGV